MDDKYMCLLPEGTCCSKQCNGCNYGRLDKEFSIQEISEILLEKKRLAKECYKNGM
jgi:hypothetical protein